MFLYFSAVWVVSMRGFYRIATPPTIFWKFQDLIHERRVTLHKAYLQRRKLRFESGRNKGFMYDRNHQQQFQMDEAAAAKVSIIIKGRWGGGVPKILKSLKIKYLKLSNLDCPEMKNAYVLCIMHSFILTLKQSYMIFSPTLYSLNCLTLVTIFKIKYRRYWTAAPPPL